MTGHKIYVRHDGISAENRLPVPLIKRCVRDALRLEGVDVLCEVSVLITDDRGIREINREYRGIDKPTDVLSFPMQEISSPGAFEFDPGALDPETGILPLGDIILSAECVDEQAREYGHTLARETAYLTVHSVLHLLGYDHVDEAEGRKKMRAREDAIMKDINITETRGKK